MRLRQCGFIGVLAVLVAAGALGPAAAGPSVATADGAYKLVPKDGITFIATPAGAKGKASAKFNFHPAKEDSFDRIKNQGEGEARPRNSPRSRSVTAQRAGAARDAAVA